MKILELFGKYDLREKCVERYGEEFGKMYDTVCSGGTIGDFADTAVFIAMVGRVKKRIGKQDDVKQIEKESEEMSANDLEKFRLKTYTRAQADLAEQIRFRLMNGDAVDVLQLLDEVERKGKEVEK